MKQLDWTTCEVLAVDDEQDNLDALRFAFRKDFKLSLATGAADAWRVLRDRVPAVVIADQRMPKVSGLQLLREIKQAFPDTQAVLLTAYADLDVLADAVNSGAVDRYVQKPWDYNGLGAVIKQSIRAHDALRENRRLREQLEAYAGYLEGQQSDPIDFGVIVGGGAHTQQLLKRVTELGASRAPVLIEGCRGADTHVVARAIHVGSERENRPYVRLDCPALGPEELKRQLFGWSKGAFDGALSNRAGRVELADGGTLYLHRVAALGEEVARHLIRLIEDGVTQRMGDEQWRAVDVRLVMSCGGQLSTESPGDSELAFSAQRWFQQSGFETIVLPALRERREDIVPLTEHLLRLHASRHQVRVNEITAEALASLEAYDWPGDVIELGNVLERGLLLAQGERLEAKHILLPARAGGLLPARAGGLLPAREDGASTHKASAGAIRGEGVSLSRRLDEIERRELAEALEQHAGNKAEVARALGIHRTTLYYRLKKLGIDT